MSLEKKLAKLICEYSLNLKKDDICLIRGETCAEPLIKEIYKKVLTMGAHPVVRMTFEGQAAALYKNAESHQLEFIPPSVLADTENVTAMVAIDSTSNTKELTGADKKKMSLHSKTNRQIRDRLFEREAEGKFRWSLCPYPTQAMAQDAEMSLEDYADFVYRACKLHEDDPVKAWQAVDKYQSRIINFLTGTSEIRIVGKETDITFNVKGRKWINCNGHHNMPDGEVFTSPVEDGVNGTIYFDVPTTFMGVEAGGVRLTIEDGVIVKASAEKGEEFLLQVLETDEGSKLVGELAFGLNESIQSPSKNILFDEKIGRTVHMAVGSSYPEAGGLNKSGIHWDMIKDMNDGQVYKDGELVFENGQFTKLEG